MRYVITGHLGLIGEALKERLDSEGHECVLAIDKREGHDVLNLENKSLPQGKTADILFHFAAKCKINEAVANPSIPHMNNTHGIFSVLEFCRKNNIRKIVVPSTSRILSKERNPYVASKVYVEELVKSYHDCYGIDYIILRPSTVYGPCFDKTSRLMSNFIVNSLKDEPLKIYGNVEKTLDFTYIDDFIEGVMLTLNTKNKIYNISGEEELRVIDVAREILKQTNSPSKILFLDPEKAQPQKVKVNTNEIKAIGYSPKIKVSEGISKMISWYKTNKEALLSYKDEGEKYYNFIPEKESLK